MKGSTVLVFLLALLSAYSPCCLPSDSRRGMSAGEAEALASSALRVLGPAVGRVEITTFDQAPRDERSVTSESPIDIVVGDSRVSPIPGIYSNCTADSRTRTIRCDLRLLDDLIDEFALIRDEGERQEIRMQLLCLILAHELGHVALNHGSAAYHGSANGFSVFKYVHYHIELEADAFAVRMLDGAAAKRDELYGLIVALTDAAVKRSLCPDTFPRPCPCPGYTNAALCSRIPLGPGLLISPQDHLTVTLTGTHPQYVVRFARLVFLSTNPRLKDIYGTEARRILEHVVVRDENGALESAEALFH